MGSMRETYLQFNLIQQNESLMTQSNFRRILSTATTTHILFNATTAKDRDSRRGQQIFS